MSGSVIVAGARTPIGKFGGGFKDVPAVTLGAHAIRAALERAGLDVRGARVSTLGGAVVDAFYLVGADGAPVTDPDVRRAVTEVVLTAAGTSG